MNLKLAIFTLVLIVLYLKYSTIMGEERLFMDKQADQVCARFKFPEE